MHKKFTTESILSKSFHSFKQNIGYFSLLTLIFLSLIFLTSIALVPLLIKSQITLIFYVLLLVAIYARLAVMIHRAIIMNEKSLSKIFSWSMHDTKFMLWAMGVSLTLMGVLFLIIYPFISAGNSGALLLFILVFFVGLGIIFARISLIFPSVAIGKDISINESWQNSKGHVGSLFFLVVFLPYMINKLINKIPDASLFLELILMLISVLIVIFEVTLLSHCYEALFEDNDEEKSNDNIQA